MATFRMFEDLNNTVEVNRPSTKQLQNNCLGFLVDALIRQFGLLDLLGILGGVLGCYLVSNMLRSGIEVDMGSARRALVVN